MEAISLERNNSNPMSNSRNIIKEMTFPNNVHVNIFNLNEEMWKKIRKPCINDLNGDMLENFKRIKQSIYELLNKDCFEDDEILRYCIGYKGNVNLALNGLTLLYHFRKDYKPSEITTNDYDYENFNKFFYLAGKDIYSRPIIHFKVKYYHCDNTPFEEFQRHIVYTLEKAIEQMPDYISKYIFIVDLKDVGRKNFSYAQFQELRKITDKMYVERLGVTYIINKGFLFSVVWGLVSPILSQGTKEKVKVADRKVIDEMKSIFDKEALERIL